MEISIFMWNYYVKDKCCTWMSVNSHLEKTGITMGMAYYNTIP
jgi:hypothetical protein